MTELLETVAKAIAENDYPTADDYQAAQRVIDALSEQSLRGILVLPDKPYVEPNPFLKPAA
jgi:hypothetical protein